MQVCEFLISAGTPENKKLALAALSKKCLFFAPLPSPLKNADQRDSNTSSTTTEPSTDCNTSKQRRLTSKEGTDGER